MNANEIARSPKLRSGSLVYEANAHNLLDYLNVRPMCVLTLLQLHSTRSSRLMALFAISFHSLACATLAWLRLMGKVQREVVVNLAQTTNQEMPNPSCDPNQR